MLKDRRDAGKLLAQKLGPLFGMNNILVLALPRGGVILGAEIAERLMASLDVLIVRKIGHPWQPELAAGAISETGAIVYNQAVVNSPGVTKEYLLEEVTRQKREIVHRQELYRGGRGLGKLSPRSIIILVDDGVATGATMMAAIDTLREERIGKLIIAVAVAPPDTAQKLTSLADAFVCLETPEHFLSVGNYYGNFEQISDEDVASILAQFRTADAA